MVLTLVQALIKLWVYMYITYLVRVSRSPVESINGLAKLSVYRVCTWYYHIWQRYRTR